MTLSFWLHVDTAETSTTTAFDTLTVSAGGATVATYSNLDAAAGYRQHSIALTGVTGSTVTVTFTGVEGSRLQTSFALDDLALNIS